MNREIKFRAWDVEGKKLGDVTSIIGGKVMFADDTWDWYKRERIILQYTGLKDKSGVGVYEGDVVTVDTIRKRNFKIGYHDHTGGYQVLTNKDEYCTVLTARNLEHYVVIGNIYENPELLEVTHV